MRRSWVALAGLSGLLAVIADAAARHALPGEAVRAEWAGIAARYALLHAAALLALAALPLGGRWLAAAGWGFAAGMVLFCGSLYLAALGAPPAVLQATPVGGTVLIAAWAALLVHAVVGWRAR
jgi:uncharacterized membrane protein YgdD (TMEM256/DUF423 family)